MESATQHQSAATKQTRERPHNLSLGLAARIATLRNLLGRPKGKIIACKIAQACRFAISRNFLRRGILYGFSGGRLYVVLRVFEARW